MSSILDALRKANSERGHVRSPIAKGELYAQTQIRPETAPLTTSGSSTHGVTTAALAVGALVLTATVFISIVVWASHTASTNAAPAPFNTAAAAPAPVFAPPAPAPPPEASAPPPAAPPRLVDQYLSSQLLPTVPITVEMDLSESLPPPTPLPAESFERDWEAEALASAIEFDEEEFESGPFVEDPVVASVPEPSTPTYRLEGIVWDEQAPMAIINGSIVGVGDPLGTATISEIRVDQVILDVEGTEVIVSY